MDCGLLKIDVSPFLLLHLIIVNHTTGCLWGHRLPQRVTPNVLQPVTQPVLSSDYALAWMRQSHLTGKHCAVVHVGASPEPANILNYVEVIEWVLGEYAVRSER